MPKEEGLLNREDHKRRIAEARRNGIPDEREIAQLAMELDVELSVAADYFNELQAELDKEAEEIREQERKWGHADNH